MTKTTFALAALIAASALTSAAHADAVRVGFGFPLGSFVAHSNENYSARDFRRSERPRVPRRAYEAQVPARKIVKIRQAPKADVAETTVKAPATPVVTTAKLEDKLASDPATTTVIEKTPVAKSDVAAVSNEAKETVNADNAVADDKPAVAKADAVTTTATAETKHVCRRYSPAIAQLIDVPCDE
ncbi:MAG: hypothetical protein JSR99_11500 [Proteobacteria bacterium]|nr:hypothetical protein [Pseudomonadota bacterium]